jgi:hypothetical protein
MPVLRFSWKTTGPGFGISFASAIVDQFNPRQAPDGWPAEFAPHWLWRFGLCSDRRVIMSSLILMTMSMFFKTLR